MGSVLERLIADDLKITLVASDAHEFYRKFNFSPNANIAKKLMVKRKGRGILVLLDINMVGIGFDCFEKLIL